VLSIAATASAQVPDVVVTGAAEPCWIILPCGEQRTDWIGWGFGYRSDEDSDIEVIAAAPGGRLLALLANAPLRVVEIFPDNTRVPVASVPNLGGFDLIVARSGAFFVLAGLPGTRQILAFDAAGNHVATYNLPLVYGTMFELAADQCTLFNTEPASPSTVRRFNVCSGTPLPDFAIVPAGVTDIDVLPDGEVLLATLTGLQRYSTAGVLTRSYPIPESVMNAGLTDHGVTALVMTGPDSSTLLRVNLLSGQRQDLIPELGINFARSVVPRAAWTAAIGQSFHGGSDVPALSTWAMLVVLAGLALLGIRRV
jgi:hypothetical protein